MNNGVNAKRLFDAFAVEQEAYKLTPPDEAEPVAQNLKAGSLKKLNDYINPILADQDPDEEVEDEYKRRHDQVFCWRFLRAVAFADQQNFNTKTTKAF